MLPPDNDSSFRVVGLDPGTETFGVAVLDLSLQTGEIVVVYSETLALQKLLRHHNYRSEEETYGGRTARLMALEDSLFNLFEQLQPHAICSESPFLSRFPEAFAALTECVSYARRAVCRYDRYLPLEVVDPPTAKKAVGMKVKRGMTKDDVKIAVAKLPIRYAEGIVLEDLDEHQVDAIAVAYYQALIFRGQIPGL
jgi:Holliday junction resolvasome RuvABC endonuclease subunit